MLVKKKRNRQKKYGAGRHYARRFSPAKRAIKRRKREKYEKELSWRLPLPRHKVRVCHGCWSSPVL